MRCWVAKEIAASEAWGFPPSAPCPGLTAVEPRLTVRDRLGPGPADTNPNQEREVKRYMLLHFGFEPPTPEIMTAWNKWFDSIAEVSVENGGFHGGAREISSDGSKDLPMDRDAITGYSIINAESLDAAEKIAQQNPFVASIRVYEIMAG